MKTIKKIWTKIKKKWAWVDVVLGLLLIGDFLFNNTVKNNPNNEGILLTSNINVWAAIAIEIAGLIVGVTLLRIGIKELNKKDDK